MLNNLFLSAIEQGLEDNLEFVFFRDVVTQRPTAYVRGRGKTMKTYSVYSENFEAMMQGVVEFVQPDYGPYLELKELANEC